MKTVDTPHGLVLVLQNANVHAIFQKNHALIQSERLNAKNATVSSTSSNGYSWLGTPPSMYMGEILDGKIFYPCRIEYNN